MNLSHFRVLLREIIESELTRGKLRDSLRKARPIVNHLVSRGGDVNDALDSFIDENSDTWSKLLALGDVSYLGSGRQGSAFSLGEYVLKLQPGSPRTAEIQGSLYAGAEGAGDLPNVLDTGTMNSDRGPVGWSVVEKFSDVSELGSDPDWANLWNQIKDGIADLVKRANRDAKGKIIRDPKEQKSFMTLPTQQVVSALKAGLDPDLMSSVAEKHRLSSDWFPKFIQMLKSNYSRGMVDFKPDNMGIRRKGAEGEIVLFDAASAMKRDIKRWEPH